MTPNIRCLALHLNRGRGATAEVNGTLTSMKMTRCALYKNIFVFCKQQQAIIRGQLLHLELTDPYSKPF